MNVQVLPFETGVHAGLTGFFDIFRFASDPTIVHGEDYETGHPTADPDAVESRSLRYDHLQAAALSVKDSATLIRRVMEERYGEQLAPDRDHMAYVELQRRHGGIVRGDRRSSQLHRRRPRLQEPDGTDPHPPPRRLPVLDDH